MNKVPSLAKVGTLLKYKLTLYGVEHAIYGLLIAKGTVLYLTELHVHKALIVESGVKHIYRDLQSRDNFWKVV